MPRYFLHVRTEDERVEDIEGEEFQSLDGAITSAFESAREVLIDRLRQNQRADGVGSRIEIADAHDVTLALVEFKDVVAGGR